MKIKFVQSGGFAGLTKEADVNTDDLSEEDAKFFQDIIDQVDFFNIQTKDTQPLPDVEQIYINVEKEGKKHMVSWSLLDIPDQLKPLIDKLKKQAEIKKF
ncbi:MAG: protealysin inhibitor emfourin [Candidatus Helarchaeota archaeon]